MIDTLKTPGGNYAMLALDQREALRDMFPRQGSGEPVLDVTLRAFKALAVRELAPYSSGVLLDRGLGLPNGRPDSIPRSKGLIVAVDALDQDFGGPVRHTTVDATITPEYLREVGAAAIKFLVIWRAGARRSENRESTQRVVELAREAGVASLVEGIVRTDDDSPFESPEARDAAILAAAEDLMQLRPDLYKAEVPGNRPGDQSRVTEQSKLMSDIVGGDWVVLSNGVLPEDFAEAVRCAVAGGAKGFLAGRAIWADTLREPNAHELLQTRSVERLKNLTAIVDSPR